jgi:hypothetical protein
MSMFTPATNTSAHLKMGILGFQGGGKSKTAAKTTIGLVQYMKKLGIAYADKPVFFLDTETGSDWLLPDFAAAGIPVETAKTRAFSDLVAAVPVAEKDASALLVDSASHYWKELCESYCRMKARMLKRPNYRLQINDWNFLKGEEGWGKFSSLYVNSRLHIILCGRAGYEFNMDEDDEGNKELQKTGVKMRAEGEFGYEPSLLVYMELKQQLKGRTVVKQWRDATILKDRADVIDGKVFENPGFESFLPHIARLNLGGAHLGVDTTRVTVGIALPDSRDNRSTQRAIVLDEIKDLLVIHHPSTGADDKKAKIVLLKTHFEASWAEIETVMSLERLRAGYDALHVALEGKPSKYHQAPAPEMNDSLPDRATEPKDLPPVTSHDAMMKQAVEPLDHTDVNGTPAFLRRESAPSAAAKPNGADGGDWYAAAARRLELHKRGAGMTAA